MNFLKTIFTRRKAQPSLAKNSSSKATSVSKVRDIHPEVRQRLSHSIQTYRQEFVNRRSDNDNPAPSIFSVFPTLRAKWDSINTFYCEHQPHLRVEMNSASEELLEERLEFLGACYSVLRSSEVPYIFLPFNFVQLLLQTFQDVVLSASISLSAEAAGRLIELLGLLHWCVVEDQSTLLLCEDFIQTFVQCFNCLLKFGQRSQQSDYACFRRTLFNFLQTNYALGELYAAHVDIEQCRWLNNFLRYILEVYRGVFALASGPRDFFYEVTLHSYSDLLPDTLAQCLSVSVAHSLPVFDFFSLTLAQLRKLANRLTDEVDVSILKSTVFELALPLLLSLYSHYQDVSLKPALIFKSVQIAEFIRHMSSQSDGPAHSLQSRSKELFYSTVLAYIQTGSTSAKSSFMEDRQTDISCFFRYVFELDLKLFAGTEVEGNLMMKFEVLSVPEVVSVSKHFPPIVQAYSLEFIDRYLEDSVKHNRTFASLVACGLCEVLFEAFLFDLPVLSEASARYSEIRRSATARSHSIVMKLLVSEASRQQVLSSLRLGLARNWNKLSFQMRAFELVAFLTTHEAKAKEFSRILLEDRLLLFYLQLLDDHVLVESGEMDMEVVCTILQVVSHFLGQYEFATELEMARGLFSKMCGAVGYYQQASTHLFYAFKFLEVDTPLYADIVSVISRLKDPGHIKGLLGAVERAVYLMQPSWHKTKVQERLLAEYPVPILAKASELQELSIISKVLQLYHHIRTGLDRTKETLIMVTTANTIAQLIVSAPFALSELTTCLKELFSLIFTPLRGNFVDCAYPEMLPAVLQILVVCSNDEIAQEFLRVLKDCLEVSLFSLSSFARHVDPPTILSLFDRAALVAPTSLLLESVLKYFCRPQMLRALLRRLNASLNTHDFESVSAVIRCLKASASQGNSTYKLPKSLELQHWPRVPAYSLHFSRYDSAVNVKCQSKLFEESSCTLQFWLFPIASGELLSMSFGKDRALKIDLREEGELRLLFTKTRGQSEVGRGVVFWHSWNLVSMKLVKNNAKFIVNSTSYEATLLDFVPAEEYSDAPQVTLGFSEESSFIGEITHLMVTPGAVDDQLCLDLYNIGFTSALDLATEEVLNFHITDDKSEALSFVVDQYRSKAILTLASQGTELPVAQSPAAVKAKQKEVRGTTADSLSLEAKRVYVCSGPSLIQAFHSAGGIKILIPLIGKVVNLFPESEELVNDLLILVYRLLRTKNALSMLEVVKESLLDMLAAQLQTLGRQNLVTPRTLKVCEKLATLPWVFHLPKSISALIGEEQWTSYLENPPSIRLMTDYKIWRGLDQPAYYQTVQKFAGRRLFNGPLMHPLRLQILNYFLKLTRSQEADFLNSESSNDTLALHLSMADLVSFLTIELQQLKPNCLAAFRLLLQLLSLRPTSEYQGYVGKKTSKVVSLVQRLSELLEFCREGLPEARHQSCIHLVSSVLMALMDLRVTKNGADSSVLDELKDTVFKASVLCCREEMNRLLFQYYRKFKLESSVSLEFLRYFEVLFRDDLANHPQDRDSVFFTTEIIVDLMRIPVSSLQFAKDYELLLGFAFKKLMSPLQEVFGSYLHAIVEMLLQLKLNEYLVVFLLYFIEDLHRNFDFQLSLPLIETFIEQLEEIGVDFDRSPPLPVVTDWNALANTGPSTPMVSFQLREGGTVRAMLNLLLRLLSQRPAEAVGVVELLTKYLRLKKLSEPYLFSSFQGLLSIKGALTLRYPQFERDGDLFSNEVGIWAYVFAELCELLLAQPEIRAQNKVSELAIDLLIARDYQSRAIVDLYLSKAISHDYTSWLRAVYDKLTSVHAPEGYARRRFVEYCLESFALADADYNRIELEAFYKLETKLRAIKRERKFEGLFTFLEDRSSDLARLHDFCLAYTSMKVKLVELLLPDSSFVAALPAFPNFNRARVKSSVLTVYFSEVIRTNRIHRLLGKRRLLELSRAITRREDIWSSPYEIKFWRLSSVTDGLGRRARLTPMKQGTIYADNINRKYKQLKSDVHSQEDTSPVEVVSPDTPVEVQGKPLRPLLSMEEFSLSTTRRKHCLLYTCERIQVSGVTFGRLELYWNVIIFRSKGDRRPSLPQFELGALDIFQRPKESLLVFSMHEVEEVLWKRFMHTRAALEVFLKNGRSYLFNIFDSAELLRLKTFFLSEAESLIPFKECTAEQTAVLTKKWKAGSLSNFEYVMQLNKYASRSYNDLNQYPVFPWVLSNYVADTPNWTEADFRDLTKPIGAIDEDSKEKAVARIKQLEQVDGILPYNYGTHYTSGGVVLYYLLRLEPYSNQAILLHDNKFDIADRLFSSIRSSWDCTLKNYADNKELLPEFYYLAEGFMNLHNYNLGWKQSGAHVHDVEMPAWACHPSCPGMNPYRFVYYQRKALEHSQVSSRLHRWIDLIFGCRQASKDDINVYPALSYERNFANKLAECEAEGLPKVTLLTEVAHYGQTPVQLFDRPHEKRSTGEKRKATVFSDFSWNTLHCTEPLSPDQKVSKKHSRRFDQANVLSVQLNSGLSLVTYQYEGSTCLYIFDASKSGLLKSLYQLPTRDTCLLEDVSPMAGKAAAATIIEDEWLVSGLHNDNSFRLYKASIKPLKLALKLTVKFHADVVCSLVALDDLLVSGSKDGTLALWEVSLLRQEPSVKYRATLRGHSSEILKVEANSDLLLVGSMSRGGLMLLHDLRSGELFNSIRPHFSQVNTFALSSQGVVAVSVDHLAPRVVIYSISGDLGRGPLREMNFNEQDWYILMKASGDLAQDFLFQLQFNHDGDFLLCASPSFFAILPVYEPDLMPFLYPARQRIMNFAVDQDESRVVINLHRTCFVRVCKLDESQRRG
jgi:WD40 repeat protein